MVNDVITVVVFLITLVNVIINGFGIRTTDVVNPLQPGIK